MQKWLMIYASIFLYSEDTRTCKFKEKNYKNKKLSIKKKKKDKNQTNSEF